MSFIRKIATLIENRDAQLLRPCTNEMQELAEALHASLRGHGKFFDCAGASGSQIRAHSFSNSVGDQFLTISRDGQPAIDLRQKVGLRTWRFSCANRGELDQALMTLAGIQKSVQGPAPQSPSFGT